MSWSQGTCSYIEMRTFVVFLVISKLSGSYGFVEFYPYGLPVDDKSVEKNDDGSSPEIPISTLFPFFNHQHGHLIVSIINVNETLYRINTQMYISQTVWILLAFHFHQEEKKKYIQIKRKQVSLCLNFWFWILIV